MLVLGPIKNKFGERKNIRWEGLGGIHYYIVVGEFLKEYVLAKVCARLDPPTKEKSSEQATKENEWDVVPPSHNSSYVSEMQFCVKNNSTLDAPMSTIILRSKKSWKRARMGPPKSVMNFYFLLKIFFLCSASASFSSSSSPANQLKSFQGASAEVLNPSSNNYVCKSIPPIGFFSLS